MKLLLQRHIDLKDPELSIKFRDPCDKIDEIWNWCCKIYKDVLKKLIKQNEIVTYVKTFVCPHCILTGRSFEDSQHYQISDVLDSVCDLQEETVCNKSATLVPAACSQSLLPSKIIFYIDMKGVRKIVSVSVFVKSSYIVISDKLLICVTVLLLRYLEFRNRSGID